MLHLQTLILVHLQLVLTPMASTLEDQLKLTLLTPKLPPVMSASLWVMVANK